jgi:hypothetical protein
VTHKTKIDQDYDRSNEQAARIILADPEKYAGLALEWARLWWTRHMAGVETCIALARPPVPDLDQKPGKETYVSTHITR